MTTHEAIYDPSWCIEYCKAYAEQLRDKTRANRAEHAAECIEYLLSLVQKEWVGLTDEEMLVAAFQAGFDVHEDYDSEDDPDTLHWWSEDGEPCDYTLHKLRDIIEAKLKEKNT